MRLETISLGSTLRPTYNNKPLIKNFFILTFSYLQMLDKMGLVIILAYMKHVPPTDLDKLNFVI